jgi:hypothetical protein
MPVGYPRGPKSSHCAGDGNQTEAGELSRFALASNDTLTFKPNRDLPAPPACTFDPGRPMPRGVKGATPRSKM